MQFVHLNLHTEFSIVDGIVRLEELMPACNKYGFPSVAVTDQNNLFAQVKFFKKALANGIKPLFGVEAWIAFNLLDNDNKTSITSSGNELYKCILLAQNNRGHNNITRLISRAYLERHNSNGDNQNNVSLSQHSQPIILQQWLEENNNSDDIIMLSGAQFGIVGAYLLTHFNSNSHQNSATQDIALIDNVKLQNIIAWHKQYFSDRFYLELQRVGRNDDEKYVQLAINCAEQYDLPVVATNAVRFLHQEDFEAHEARVCINAGYVLADTQRPHEFTSQQYLRSNAEMCKLFADIPSAIINSLEISKRCNVKLQLGKSFLPIFPIPENIDLNTFFIAEANNGLRKRLSSQHTDKENIAENQSYSHNKEQKQEKEQEQQQECHKTQENHQQLVTIPEEYQQRLNYELNVIQQMGFPSYFLIVADFIRWAKHNGIPVGPGRGSGAGSLVAYALEITDLDPLQHSLLFERFLNPERVSLPDFDVDFCMEGRDRVIEYVVQRYGNEKVSQIITYGTMAAKAVVRDVGRVLGYPYGFVDKIAKLIPFELGIDLNKALHDEPILRKRYNEEDEVRSLIDLAKKLEGITRNAGKHAGGVVIAPSQLTDFVPLYCEEDEANASVVTQFDKDDVEAVGLVKFDFLGLRTLTIINWAIETINARLTQTNQPKIDINSIPLNDEATYKLLQNYATIAVFQLESRGMRDLIKRLQPDCFEDIVALVALYRPGPLQSGMVDDFIERKHGRAEASYFHPSLEPVLNTTYGVILYQEQVMQIAQVLAGYSLGSADILRRAMGKKKPEEMALQRTIFLDGAIKKNIDKHLANQVFDLMEKFAGYGFNKSHSAAYALVSYQTAWLKAHFPAEFMASVLSSDMDNTDKVVVFIQECKNLQLNIIPPDINQSMYKFTVDQAGNSIIYGLGAIKSVGQNAVEIILTEREKNGEFKDLGDFCCRCDNRKINKRAIEALVYAGAFDKIAPNRASLIATLPLALQLAEQQGRNKAQGQLDFFALMENDETNDQQALLEYNIVDEWNDLEKLTNEKSVLGLYLTGHPIDKYIPELKKYISHTIIEISDLQVSKTKSTKINIAGIVNNTRAFITKSGKRLIIINIEDQTASIELTLFEDLYAKTQHLICNNSLIIAEVEISIDKFTEKEKARPLNIQTLEQTRIENAKGLTLKLQQNIQNINITTQNIANILRSYTAKNFTENSNHTINNSTIYNKTCPVYIFYSNNDNNKHNNIQATIKLHDKWQVVLKDLLFDQLHQLTEIASIEIN